jgi:hypothetical protein
MWQSLDLNHQIPIGQLIGGQIHVTVATVALLHGSFPSTQTKVKCRTAYLGHACCHCRVSGGSGHSTMEPTVTKIQNHVSSLLMLTGKWEKLKADAPAQTSG